MKCPTCNIGALRTGREEYQYAESGLPDVVLVGLEVRRCTNPECGEVMPVIPQLAELHRVLAFTLAEQKEKLRGTEIRFMRKYLGRSSVDMARILHVTPETVSRWENDQTPMGSASELLFRFITMTVSPAEKYPIDMLEHMTLEDTPRAPIRLRGHGKQLWKPAASSHTAS